MAFEPADRTRVLKRVTEILNLCDPGTYSATLSTRNKTRNATAIADFTDEAGLIILKTIAERPNEFRYLLEYDTTAITNSGAALPAHSNGQPPLGPPTRVKITLSNGGIVRDGERRDYRKIEAYRENPSNVYDSVAHNAVGSVNAGLYDIWERRFFFTGYSAILTLARMPVRADTSTLIPGCLENTWVRLAVGEAAKVGTGAYETAIIGEYGKRGLQDIEEFKGGTRVFREVDDPQPVSAAHQLVK
jgi:hypothetical protein